MHNLKHTKGNWRSHLMNVFIEDRDNRKLTLITSVTECVQINDLGNVDEETEANARLISAAPDMLEVLMSMENDSNIVPDFIWKMRNEAIKKAIEGDTPTYLKFNERKRK